MADCATFLVAVSRLVLFVVEQHVAAVPVAIQHQHNGILRVCLGPDVGFRHLEPHGRLAGIGRFDDFDVAWILDGCFVGRDTEDRIAGSKAERNGRRENEKQRIQADGTPPRAVAVSYTHLTLPTN